MVQDIAAWGERLAPSLRDKKAAPPWHDDRLCGAERAAHRTGPLSTAARLLRQAGSPLGCPSRSTLRLPGLLTTVVALAAGRRAASNCDDQTRLPLARRRTPSDLRASEAERRRHAAGGPPYRL